MDTARYTYHDDANRVDVTIPIHEGREYFFGDVSFTGQKIYDADTLRGQIDDLLKQPYTDARVDDIPRRLQAYFKARGYYEAKVAAPCHPAARPNGRGPVPVLHALGAGESFDEMI